MEIREFDIQGPKLITLDTYKDNRGFFVERFNANSFEKSQLPTQFCQDNFSRSAPGVLRGLHFQYDEPQGKLVTCLSGEIFDVAVDLRRDSPTFGRHLGVKLSGELPQHFWVPPGFAHGFLVTGNQPADVMYKVNVFYNSSGETGIRWNDSALNIDWPKTKDLILSDKDQVMQTFEEFQQSGLVAEGC